MTPGPHRRGHPAARTYAGIRFATALLFSLVFTANVIYHVTVVELDPLQLVLVGTILEGTIFLFEIPTGIVADVRGRRLSVIVGHVLIGCGFLIEGAVPAFWAVALAQVVWGIGYTFTSGATEAWVADEVGEEAAGDAYLRGAQAGQVGGLLGIPLSAALGGAAIRVPILVGGAMMVLLGLALSLVMQESGFRPLTPGERVGWGSVASTLRGARGVVARRPQLLALLGVGLFFGLYSEGYDRLWTVHMLEDVGLPALPAWEPVVWFAAVRVVGSVVGLGAVEAARRRLASGHARALGTGVAVATATLLAALVAFGLLRSFWAAVVVTWVVGASRSVIHPLYTTWFNAQVDEPEVRATLISAGGQVDSVGQVAGGPLIGAIGRALSVPAALIVSAALLSPALPLSLLAMRRGQPARARQRA